MFIPSEQVIIAMDDVKTTTTLFKEFQSSNPNDRFEISNLVLRSRKIEMIHSDKFYDYFFEFLAQKLDTDGVNNLKTIIGRQNKIKFFYATPKELLNVIPSSNVSASLYGKAYCLLFMTEANEIIIVLQAIRPITAVDESLFNIILSHIVKGCIRYVIGNTEVLKRHVANKSIFLDYELFNRRWYNEFIKIIVNKYSMLRDSSTEEKSLKEAKIENFKNELIKIIKTGDRQKVIPKKELLTFFKYTLPVNTDLVKEKEERSAINDMISIKTIGMDTNKEMLIHYLEEIASPLSTIMENNIFQPEVLMSNQEYSIWVEIIKQSYEKALDNIIDPTHMIKHTMFQEMYHYYTAAENYSTYRNDIDTILKLLANGEIYDF